MKEEFKVKEIVDELIKRNLTIATMESCTGGALACAITDVEGASDILKFSAITYSNEYKIKMGVNKEIIDKYSVYSSNTAKEMALNISQFAHSDIGIGITGKLNRADKQNNYGKDNEVFVSIYYQKQFYNYSFIALAKTRHENKEYIVKEVVKKLKDIL